MLPGLYVAQSRPEFQPGGGANIPTIYWCPHQVLKATGTRAWTPLLIMFHKNVKRNVKYNYLSFFGLLCFLGLFRFLGLFVLLDLFLLLALYLTFVFATLFSLTTAFFCWNLSFALFFGLLRTVLKLFKNIMLITSFKYQMWF